MYMKTNLTILCDCKCLVLFVSTCFTLKTFHRYNIQNNKGSRNITQQIGVLTGSQRRGGGEIQPSSAKILESLEQAPYQSTQPKRG